MSRPVKDPVSGFSPYYGCFIIAAAALIFGGIIAWSAYTLLKQNSEIDEFTVDAPALPALVELDAAAGEALAAKTSALAAAINAGKPGSLSLTLPELNTLVAQAPDLGHGTYAEIVRFTGTDPEKNLLLAEISMPINQLPFSKKPKRYLVGQAAFEIQLSSEGPDAHIIAIVVPGKTVPAGFVDSQQTWTWVAPYRENAELAAIMKALRSVRVTSEGLTLSTEAE